MTRGWAIVLVAALFLSGVAIGALGMHLYYFEQHRSMARPAGGPPGFPSFLFRGRMAAELGLSAEQEQEIHRILKESHRQAADIRQDVRPRLEELLQETVARIDQVLTPEQRQTFEQMRERQRRRARFFRGPEGEHRERRGPGSRRPRHAEPPPEPQEPAGA